VVDTLGDEVVRLILGVVLGGGVPGFPAMSGDLGDAAGKSYFDSHLFEVVEMTHFESEGAVMVADPGVEITIIELF